MQTIKVNPTNPEPALIAQAAEILRRGGLVAFPTETVYGLGANALDQGAVERIFLAKGRPAQNPIIVHAAGTDAARRVTTSWPAAADKLARHFWPGPLTLVLPKALAIPDAVTAGGTTVAVRVPAHPVALALIQAAGVPVAAPSANRSSRLSPTRAEHVLKDLAGQINMVLDGGPSWAGLESTVLDMTSEPPRLLRPGLIAPADIEVLIGPIIRTLAAMPDAAKPLPSPGLLARHYSPKAKLECLAGDHALARVATLSRQGIKTGWLSFTSHPALPGVTIIVMPVDVKAYSSRLYAELHALDDAGMERIVVTLPPESEDWLPVRDRLSRACGV